MVWQSMANSPDGQDNYFLIRPPGISMKTGEKYIPTVVFRIGDSVYRPENEVSAMMWSIDPNDIRKGPTTDVNKANMQWHPLPPRVGELR